MKGAVQHLSDAVRFVTISNSDDNKVDWSAFENFHTYLEENYPLVKKTCIFERVGKGSLIIKWPGKGIGKPFTFLAHIDVVPVNEETLFQWKYPPFSGYNDGDYIWGRGSADMKAQLIAIIEAMEKLISQRFIPNQDVYFCLNHNEEVFAGSNSGAQDMADLLKQHGIKFEFAIEEAGSILLEPPFDLDQSVAMIGVAEKGYAELKVTILGEGGHSAEPWGKSAIGIMAELICAVEKNPMIERITTTVDSFINSIAPYMGSSKKDLILKSPEYAIGMMSQFRKLDAMIRTTIVPTILNSGHIPNSIPGKAEVLFNVRLLHGDTVDDIISHIHKIADTIGIGIGIEFDVEVMKSLKPSLESDTTTPAYRTLEKVFQYWDPSLIIAPYLVTGGTDSKYYSNVTDAVYRVSPFYTSKKTPSGAHANNEHVSIKQFIRAIDFFMRFIIAQSARYDKL